MTPGGSLHGYRVLDLADETAALCGKMFADLGADVVKVEPPGGCATRRIPPFLDQGAGPDRSAYFQALAAGKRSVTLDLQRPGARELLARLAGRADFLIESWPAGYLDGLGLSYPALAARMASPSGGSTLTTSAPRSANIFPHSAAVSSARSRTR